METPPKAGQSAPFNPDTGVLGAFWKTEHPIENE
jgi:hypothetical protein